jgi:hypothetical protein
VPTALVLLLHPLLLSLSFSLVSYLHSSPAYDYKDGECLLKMVNDTNSEHFDQHPMWPHRGFSSTCDTQEYFDIMQHNEYEHLFTTVLVQGGALLGIGAFLYSPTPLVQLLPYIPVAAISTAMVFVTAHYQHDNTFLCGNIQHHSNYKNDGENGSGIKTVPHGVANPILFAQLLVMFLVHRFFAAARNERLVFADFLKVYLPFQAAWLVWNMLYVHPHVHNEGASIYPWPLNHVMQDYEGHVLCHHVTGLCMSSMPLTGEPHDLLLELHGYLYKADIIHRQTFSEDVANYAINVVLTMIAWVYLKTTVVSIDFIQKQGLVGEVKEKIFYYVFGLNSKGDSKIDSKQKYV